MRVPCPGNALHLHPKTRLAGQPAVKSPDKFLPGAWRAELDRAVLSLVIHLHIPYIDSC